MDVSVVILSYNEEARIKACLEALEEFDDIWVVDSFSQDRTTAIAEDMGAQVIQFKWNGQYPKKKQWCLDFVPFAHDWVLMLDADEIVTPDLTAEMANINFANPSVAGYFIEGRFKAGKRAMRFGCKNNKLQLLNRRKMEFPVIDDLGCSAVWEVEGHYQPVLKPDVRGPVILRLHNYLIHDALDDYPRWLARHERYALWERHMNKKRAWPEDPDPRRERMKRRFRKMPLRPLVAFLHAYIIKLGILERKAGLIQASRRFRYYWMI